MAVVPGRQQTRYMRVFLRVLLVEDDPMIGDSINIALKGDGYAIDWIRDGEAAILSLECQHYDLVLLDLGLPKKNGLEVLTFIRNHKQSVAVLVITARDSVEDRIKGLDLGADDYVVKPFSIAELSARMRAVFRRKGGTGDPLLGNGVISLDPSKQTVFVNTKDQEGKDISLSNREFSLLQALLIRPGAILSRSDLEDRIYGWGEEVDSNAIEFLIHGLRKKLGKKTIKNIRGAGWLVSKKE